MKRLFAICILVLASVGIALAAPAQKIEKTTSAKAPVAKKQISMLFVQSAKSAELMASKVAGNYKLVLQEPNDFVLYFSDRPNRVAGQLSVAKFINDWNKGSNSFKKDNPNVAVYSATFEGKTSSGIRSDVFSLSNPALANNTLTYMAKPVGHNHALKLGKYKNVALFVDAVDDSCGSQFFSCATSGDALAPSF